MSKNKNEFNEVINKFNENLNVFNKWFETTCFSDEEFLCKLLFVSKQDENIINDLIKNELGGEETIENFSDYIDKIFDILINKF